METDESVTPPTVTMFKDSPPSPGSSPELLPLETPGGSRQNLLAAEPPRIHMPEEEQEEEEEEGDESETAAATGECPGGGSQCVASLVPRQHRHQRQRQQQSRPGCSGCSLHVPHHQHHHPPHHHQHYQHQQQQQQQQHRRYDDPLTQGRDVVPVLCAGHPMKKLLTLVKTFLRGARARLQWSRRCARRQFSFVAITESSTDLTGDGVSFLDEEVRRSDDDDNNNVESKEDDGRDFQGGQEEEERLVRDEEEEEGGGEEEEEGSRRGGRFSRWRRTCRTRMSRVTAVSLLWSLLSLLVAGSCAFSFCYPSWITHPDRLHSFGLFTQCARDPRAPHPRAACQGYGPGGGVDVGSIPSGAWQASTLLFGSGTGLQCLGALVTLLLLVLPAHPYSGHRLALLCGYMQTLAVLLLVSGLVMFPLGFSTAFFHYYCDSSGAFCVGHCRMGWSYVLAITATALAIFCPVLSNYTDLTLDKDEDRETERDLVTNL